MKIAVNGRIQDEALAVISIYDHGFLYGIGLFETFRTYRGQPFLLEEHLRRLQDGCDQLGIAVSLDPVEISNQIKELLTVNSLQDAYFRYTVTAGTDMLGLPTTEQYKQPSTIIYMKELSAIDSSLYVTGRPLQLLKMRRNTPEGRVRFKSLHYMNNILAKRELQTYGCPAGSEGLMLDEKNHVAEGIVSNIFFIKKGALYTPSIETGILPGITRAYVMRIAAAKGIPLHEGLYGWNELANADEVFLTNSIQEVVPVCTLLDTEGESQSIGTGRIGPITGSLLAEYRNGNGEANDL